MKQRFPSLSTEDAGVTAEIHRTSVVFIPSFKPSFLNRQCQLVFAAAPYSSCFETVFMKILIRKYISSTSHPQVPLPTTVIWPWPTPTALSRCRQLPFQRVGWASYGDLIFRFSFIEPPPPAVEPTTFRTECWWSLAASLSIRQKSEAACWSYSHSFNFISLLLLILTLKPAARRVADVWVDMTSLLTIVPTANDSLVVSPTQRRFLSLRDSEPPCKKFSTKATLKSRIEAVSRQSWSVQCWRHWLVSTPHQSMAHVTVVNFKSSGTQSKELMKVSRFRRYVHIFSIYSQAMKFAGTLQDHYLVGTDGADPTTGA